ncbi:MAG: hypothetical protein SFY92_05900 [Verrucomicrobiae bacterium]|nr:hypothetical protein [Verrucomicrobiae bacterium]
MDSENDFSSDSSPLFLVIAVILLLISGSINLYMFKIYRVLSDQSNAQKVQAQAADRQAQTLQAMVNDLRAYSADKPKLQALLTKLGVQ